MSRTTIISSDCAIWWRLVIEAHGPDIEYIPGPENFVTDDLSILPMIDETTDTKQIYIWQLKTTKQTEDVTQEFPLDMAIITYSQQK